MRAIHTFGFFGGVLRKRGATDDDIAQAFRDYPPMEHPIVRTHPETGRKALFLHPDFIRGIVGMTPGRSKALLKHLYAQAATPEYQCRFPWRMNSIAFWDNRSTQHYAVSDYWPAVRRMERVSIIGDTPF